MIVYRRILACIPFSKCSLRYMPNMACTRSMSMSIVAMDEWTLGANWRPPCSWPRKYPTIARTAPSVWRGTCHRERTIWLSVSIVGRERMAGGIVPQEPCRLGRRSRRIVFGFLCESIIWYPVLCQKCCRCGWVIMAHYRLCRYSFTFRYVIHMMLVRQSITGEAEQRSQIQWPNHG